MNIVERINNYFNSDGKYYLISFLGFAILGILAYSNIFDNEFHLDDIYWYNNEYVINFDIAKLFEFNRFRIIPFASFALNYMLWGLEPAGYHAFNLLVHLINTVLVWQIALLTFQTKAMKSAPITKYSRLLALFAALIFLLHPIQTSAVTYVYQRLASIAAMFSFLTFFLFIRAFLSGKNINRILFLCLAAVSMLFAMLSKQNTFIMPIILLLYYFTFFTEKFRFKLSYIFILLGIAVVGGGLFYALEGMKWLETELFYHTAEKLTPVKYLLTQFRVIVTYFRLLVLPINQNLYYDYSLSHSLFELKTMASLILHLAIITTTIIFYQRNKLLCFSVLFFYLALSVESSIILIQDVIFEHRLYLPMAAFGMFLMAVIYPVLKKWPRFVYILPIILLTFGAMTFARNIVWDTAISLWNDTIEKAPNKQRSYNNRGLHYYMQREYDKAIQDYSRGLEIDHDNELLLKNRAKAYLADGKPNLALVDLKNFLKYYPKQHEVMLEIADAYMLKDEPDEAMKFYNRYINKNPESAKGFIARGNAFHRFGNIQDAIIDLTIATEMDTTDVTAYKSLGYVFFSQKDMNNALINYQKAESINENDWGTQMMLGMINADLNNNDLAIKHFNRAVELAPNESDVYMRRGEYLLRLKNYTGAIENLHKANELNPDNKEIYKILIDAYGMSGNQKKMISTVNDAISKWPDNPEFYYISGNVYSSLGDVVKASEAYQKSLELNPDSPKVLVSFAGLLLKAEKYQESISKINKAIELKPAAIPYFMRAKVYEKMGNLAQAKSDLNTALSFDPNFKPARDMLKKVNS